MQGRVDRRTSVYAPAVVGDANLYMYIFHVKHVQMAADGSNVSDRSSIYSHDMDNATINKTKCGYNDDISSTVAKRWHW